MIYFMLPDAEVPTGGVRHTYVMVEELVRLGYDATVWHGAPSFRCAWFSSTAPVVQGRDLVLRRGDVLVMPEINPREAVHLTNDAPVVMNVQNHFYVFDAIHANWEGSYPGWPNAVATLVSSHAIQAFMQRAFAAPLPCYLINYDIDSMFRPAEKERVIAFMPRKRASDLAAIISLLKRSPILREWEFDEIDLLPLGEVAARLGRAAIFLSSSDREGFGLPPAEAMASECYVVGFTGDGGREFMFPGLCSIIEDQNLGDFVGAVERTVRTWETDRALINTMTQAARRFITSTYTRPKLVTALDTAFSRLLENDSAAVQRSDVTVYHYDSLVPQDQRPSLDPVAESASGRLKAHVRRWVPPVAWEALGRARSRSIKRASSAAATEPSLD